MQIAIDISEGAYNYIKANGARIPYHKLIDLIKNGTPLPKDYGRLIDADRLRSMYSINRGNFNTVVGIQKWVDDAPTIIEADKEKEE